MREARQTRARDNRSRVHVRYLSESFHIHHSSFPMPSRVSRFTSNPFTPLPPRPPYPHTPHASRLTSPTPSRLSRTSWRSYQSLTQNPELKTQNSELRTQNSELPCPSPPLPPTLLLSSHPEIPVEWPFVGPFDRRKCRMRWIEKNIPCLGNDGRGYA